MLAGRINGGQDEALLVQLKDGLVRTGTSLIWETFVEVSVSENQSILMGGSEGRAIFVILPNSLGIHHHLSLLRNEAIRWGKREKAPCLNSRALEGLACPISCQHEK
jgi:hypothetical protein